MAKQKFVLKFRLSWWFRYLYLPLLFLVWRGALSIGLAFEPDPQKVDYWFKKAVRINAKSTKAD